MSKKIKINALNESLLNMNSNTEVIEDVDYSQHPDFTILDVTVIPDEQYHPTIQNILIDLEESSQLHESQSDDLSINILSETVNERTGYSMSLFEFESMKNDKRVLLSLTLTESTKYAGVFNVSAYTSKGEKVFETNTQKPKQVISNYLNSLSTHYLVEYEIAPSNDEFIDAIENIKVAGPSFRGDTYPAFDARKINEAKFPDDLRFKEYNMSYDNGMFTLDWISQGAFEEAEAQEFIKEVLRAIEVIKEDFNPTEDYEIRFNIENRDHTHSFGYNANINKGGSN